MRIGIDCRVLSEKGHAGIAQYTKHLVAHLLKHDTENDYVLFLSELLYREDDCPQNVEQKLCNSTIPFWSSHLVFSKLVNSSSLNVFHGPSGMLPFFLKIKSIITIHDLFLIEHPEWFNGKTWFVRKIFIPYSIKKADTIISVSEATKNSLTRLFPRVESKIKVVHEGVVIKQLEYAKDEFSLKYNHLKEKEIILFVGTIEPRKNLLVLLDAFEVLRNKRSEVQLVIAGKVGVKSETTVKRIQNTEGVFYAGYISEEEKRYLFDIARVFAWPSLAEGFGLPPLEAMCAGVSVVASDCVTTREILGNDCLYSDPKDPVAFSSALGSALTIPEQQKGVPERCVLLSWDNTAKKTQKIYFLYDQKRRA